MKDRRMFALAGLWDSYEKDKKRFETFAIVTTAASPLMAPVHDRMPVIVDRDDIPVWLDPGLSDFEVLKRYLRPYDGEGLQATPVSTYVSNSQNEGPDCIQAAN